jgi:hypothetical protein
LRRSVGKKFVTAGYVEDVSWTTDDVYVPRNALKGVEAGPEVKKAAEDSDYALKDVLFDVLRRFPEAHDAVVLAMGERVDVIRARRRNNGDG